MASQQFYNPKRQKSNGGVYDDEPVAPLVDQGSPRASVASQNAQQTLNNIDDTLRDQEQQSGGFYRAGDESSDKKNLSSDELNDAENTAKPAAATAAGGTEAEGGFRAAVKTRVKKFIKNKFAVGAAAAGGITAGTVVLLIIFALGLYKIPDFGQHIAAYQFARITRDMSRSTDDISASTLAVDSADDGVWAQLKARYGTVGKVADTWNDINGLKYNNMISNMQRDNKLSLTYENQSFLRPKGQLTKITINGTDFKVKPPTLTRYIPGVQFVNDVKLSQDIAPTFRTALATNDIGTIVRNFAAEQAIRNRLGIGLFAWTVGKYTGKTPEQNEAQMEADAHDTIDGDDSAENPAVGKAVNEAADNAAAAEETALQDPAEAAAIVASPNKLPTRVLTVLNNAFKATSLDDILGFLNPIYKFAAPYCLVYDGSLQNSGQTINNESNESQRSFYMVESAGSQVEDGYQTNGDAAGAFGWKLGNIQDSNAEMRASGQTVDTSNDVSTESSPTGQFSIVSSLVPPPLDSVLGKASEACPVLASTWAGWGLAGANVALLVLTLGTAAPVDAGSEAAAQVSLKELMSELLGRVIGDSGGNITAGSVTKFGTTVVANAGATAGATFLAKWIVASQIGEAQSPLATGPAFDNEADSGGNQNANEAEREGLYGRPLTKDEIAMNNVEDQQYAAAQTSSESAVARYLSPSNPDSLITHVASMVSLHFGSGNFTSLFNIGSSILNPINAFGSAINSLSTSRVGAATTDTFDYGNVQWGYSSDEQAKLDLDPNTNLPADPTYSILENRLILDQSNAETQIAAKYGPCFDPDVQIGDLLANQTGDGGNDTYYIVRGPDGYVVPNQGLCSPDNLGLDNTDPAPGYPNGYGDLVFRWRVDHMYDSGLTTLQAEQNTTTPESAMLDNSSSTDRSSGLLARTAQHAAGLSTSAAGALTALSKRIK